MSLIARLFYAAAVVLVVLGILVLTHVWKTADATWIGLMIAGGICAVVGMVFDYPRYRGRGVPPL